MPGTKLVRKVGEYRQDIVEQDGLRWILGRGTNDGLAVNHEMEPAGHSIHDFICSYFEPGVVFLDIGAHVGHYTVRAASAGCTVYAVEGNPEAAAMLRMNLLINKLHATVWALAAWSKPELLSFHQAEVAYGIRNGSASLMHSSRNPVGMNLTVSAVPLDGLLKDVEQVDVVKMDVEGSDCHVFDGMKESLARLRPVLVFEDHTFYGTYSEYDMKMREDQLPSYRWCDAWDLGVKSAEKYRVGLPD